MRVLVILLAIITLTSACSYPKSLPTIVLHFGPGVTEPNKIIEGARRWEECGFKVTVDVGPKLRECRVQWFNYENRECRLDVDVWSDRLIGEDWAWGRAYLVDRAFWIREDARGDNRANVATHEVGHLIMNSIRHLGSAEGVMSPVAGTGFTRADRDLLRSIGWPWRNDAGSASSPQVHTRAGAAQLPSQH